MKATILMLAIFLSGCMPTMTNEEIKAAVDYCISNNLIPLRFTNWNGETAKIECIWQRKPAPQEAGSDS